VLFQSLELLGSLTTPLALLVTGAQLAELRNTGAGDA
jgi:predicted permease